MRADGQKARAAAGVVLLHALLGYFIVAGLGVELSRSAGQPLKVFAVAPAAAPPPPVPAPEHVPEREGAAAPPSRKAKPTATPAPRAPSACRSWAVPVPGGSSCAGSSERPGEGSGAGGEGSGGGAGRGGSGTGGGGTAMPAERIAGELRYADYPGEQPPRTETVGVAFAVAADGRVSGCRVTSSSGNPRLDARTCALIERRFRYRPARNAAGEPVPALVRTSFDWVPPALNRRR